MNSRETESIRIAYSRAYGEPRIGRQNFDRWLAERDRKVQAQALRDAARDIPFPQDPYGGFDWESLRAARIQIDNYLSDRADQIEKAETT